jgi:hypothetical protein
VRTISCFARRDRFGDARVLGVHRVERGRGRERVERERGGIGPLGIETHCVEVMARAS